MFFRFYQQLLDQVDKWTGEMAARYAQHLTCHKGCDLCCQRKFTVSAVEAYNIALAVRQLDRGTQEAIRRKKSSCTFLINGACSIYPARPVICRTFGLPTLNRNEKGDGEISWCELNFTKVEEDFQLTADGIIDVDMLNMKMTGVNRLFLKETGLSQERIPMDEVPDLDARFS